MVVANLTTLMAPFSEEIVFRHVLFYQFKKYKILFYIMFVLSSVAFGLIHWNNFNGNVYLMIPYMCIGLVLALIYWLGRNIWFNIFTHFFFDFGQFLAALLLFVMSFVH